MLRPPLDTRSPATWHDSALPPRTLAAISCSFFFASLAAACLRADALAAAGFPLLPLEQLGALVERLLEERARDVVLLPARIERAERRLSFRRVDAMNRDLVDAELPRRLGENRRHQRVAL